MDATSDSEEEERPLATRKRGRSPSPTSCTRPPSSHRPASSRRDHHFRGGRGGSSPSTLPYHVGRCEPLPRSSPSPPFAPPPPSFHRPASSRHDHHYRGGSSSISPPYRGGRRESLPRRSASPPFLPPPPPSLRPASPRPERYRDHHYRGGRGGRSPSFPPHGGGLESLPSRSPSRPSKRLRLADGHDRHGGCGTRSSPRYVGTGAALAREGLMTYMQFNEALQDDISAESRYREYLTEHDTSQKPAFFYLHKNENWLSSEVVEPSIKTVMDEKYGEKYGCEAKSCTELFHAPESVYKHSRLKHPEFVSEVPTKENDLYFQTNMLDPNAPQGTPLMQQSASEKTKRNSGNASQVRPVQRYKWSYRRFTWQNRFAHGVPTLSGRRQSLEGECSYYSITAAGESKLRISFGFAEDLSIYFLKKKYEKIKQDNSYKGMGRNQRIMKFLKETGIPTRMDYRAVVQKKKRTLPLYKITGHVEYHVSRRGDIRKALENHMRHGPMVAVFAVSRNYDNCIRHGSIYRFMENFRKFDDDGNPIFHSACVVSFGVEAKVLFLTFRTEKLKWPAFGRVELQSVKELYGIDIARVD